MLLFKLRKMTNVLKDSKMILNENKILIFAEPVYEDETMDDEK